MFHLCPASAKCPFLCFAWPISVVSGNRQSIQPSFWMSFLFLSEQRPCDHGVCVPAADQLELLDFNSLHTGDSLLPITTSEKESHSFHAE